MKASMDEFIDYCDNVITIDDVPNGSCKKCGAVQYVPRHWMGVVPPKPKKTCNCKC